MRKLLLLFVTTILGVAVNAQKYPAKPTLSRLIKDIKTFDQDGYNCTKMATKKGFPSNSVSSGSYKLTTKSELKDYFYVEGYKRSKDAYKVSLNKNYSDRYWRLVTVTTPKDKNGVYYKIVYKVEYSQLTPNYFQDNKWNLNWISIESQECKSIGVPKTNEAQRKKIMLDYINSNRLKAESNVSKHKKLSSIVRIDSLFAPDKDFLINVGAGSERWTLIIKGDKVTDKTSDGAIEETRKDYHYLFFTAQYINGSWGIKELYDFDPSYYNKFDRAHISNSPREEIVSEFEKGMWYQSWTQCGSDKIMGKFYSNGIPICSNDGVSRTKEDMKTLLNQMITGNTNAIDAKVEGQADFVQKINQLKSEGYELSIVDGESGNYNKYSTTYKGYNQFKIKGVKKEIRQKTVQKRAVIVMVNKKVDIEYELIKGFEVNIVRTCTNGDLVVSKLDSGSMRSTENEIGEVEKAKKKKKKK